MKYVKLFENHSEDNLEWFEKITEVLNGDYLGSCNLDTDNPTLIYSQIGLHGFIMEPINIDEAMDKLKSMDEDFLDDEAEFRKAGQIFFDVIKIPVVAEKIANEYGFTVSEMATAQTSKYWKTKHNVSVSFYIVFKKSKKMAHKYRGNISSKKFGF